MFSDSHISKVGPSQDNNQNLIKDQQTKQTTTTKEKKLAKEQKSCKNVINTHSIDIQI